MPINSLHSYTNTQIPKCGRAGFAIGKSGNRTICGISLTDKIPPYEGEAIGSIPVSRATNFWTKFENEVQIFFIFSRRERYFMDISIFTKYDTVQRTEKFRNALIQMRGHFCERCKLNEWLDKPINLELHHKDGDRSNNALENLELLCPNCHSCTDNYGSKNKKHSDVSDTELLKALENSTSIRQALFSVGLSDAGANYTRARILMNQNGVSLLTTKKQDKENFCIDCGKAIYPNSTRCIKCEAKTRRIYPIERDELKQLIRTTPFTKIGEMYGVSDNAIRKWCISYQLPMRVSDIKKISDEDWVNI